ncbi:MAG: nucleoside 2-deoxyribosyltransferase [Bryobacteraceae bacterium]
MERKTVYLAGLIDTARPESLEWRKRAAEALAPYFNVLTPMRGKDDLTYTTRDNGITSDSMSSKDIILRDHNDVIDADIILVNLDTFGSSRPLVGTLFELAWSWQGRKRVVAILTEDNYLMRNHPFVVESVAAYFRSEAEAFEYIKRQA